MKVKYTYIRWFGRLSADHRIFATIHDWCVQQNKQIHKYVYIELCFGFNTIQFASFATIHIQLLTYFCDLCSLGCSCNSNAIYIYMYTIIVMGPRAQLIGMKIPCWWILITPTTPPSISNYECLVPGSFGYITIFLGWIYIYIHLNVINLPVVNPVTKNLVAPQSHKKSPTLKFCVPHHCLIPG